MSWSKLWQRGGRKVKKQAPEPASGDAYCEVASIHSHGEDQIGINLRGAIEPGGQTVASGAALTGTGDGKIRVSLPVTLPPSTAVGIAGLECQCLGVSGPCEEGGDAWVADVEVISPSLPLPQRAAG